MGLRSCTLRGLVTVVAIAWYAICASAQEQAATSTIRMTSSAEQTVEAAPAAHTDADNWGGADLTFDLPTPDVAVPSNLPNTTKRQYAVKPASFSAPAAKPISPPIQNTRSRSVVGVYNNSSAQATLSKMPRPAPVQHPMVTQPVAQAARSRGKPFQSVESGPTVSPYMNLYRNDANANMISNYYSFVRPQLDQIDANHRQAADMQRLRSQLQNAQSAGGQPVMYGTGNAGPAPVARFGDTAQFYQPTRR